MARDLLKEASHALRVEHDGEGQTAAQTRARVLMELAKTRKRRRPRWLFFLPPGALIATSTALAATGQLEFVVERARQAVEWVLPGDENASAGDVKARGGSNAATRPVLPPREVASEAEEGLDSGRPGQGDPGTKQLEPDEPEPGRLTQETQHPTQPHVESAAKQALARPGDRLEPREHRSTNDAEPPASVSPELLAYEEAHQLHFSKGDCRAAVAAWSRYLSLAPAGALAPEARYNRALCWVKLGEREQAVEALSAIASGRHGTYRKAEAQALLEALKQE